LYIIRDLIIRDISTITGLYIIRDLLLRDIPTITTRIVYNKGFIIRNLL